MPYETIDQLPVNVKRKHSEKALRAFMAAWNNVYAQTKDESRAFAAANAAAAKVDGKESISMDEITFKEAEWTAAYINDLPDSSFAYIEPGGEKDDEGKTKPRSLRHFPYKDARGKVDLPHLRNALARAPQSPFGDKAMPKLRAAAKSEGVGEFAEATFWFQGDFREGPVEEDGVHKARVKIIQPGISANNFYYSPTVLSKLVPLMEGAKAYIDHERKDEIKQRGGRSVRDIAGWYSDVYQDTDGTINGTLNFAPGSERLVEMLKVNPALVGLSINAKGRATRGEIDGRKVMIAESFDKLYSTDLVTEAAAGGEVTRMVASVAMTHEEQEDNNNMEDTDLILAQWLLAEANHKIKETNDTATYLFEEKMAWLKGEQEYNRTKEWLDAELGVWINAEKAYINEKIESIPEAAREHVEKRLAESKRPVEEIDGILQILKAAPPVRQDGGEVKKQEDKKPGEPGYKRHFL